MVATSDGKTGLLALLPYLVNGALSLAVLREMRRRGIDVTIAFQLPGSGGYTPDAGADFAALDRLTDMTGLAGSEAVAGLERLVAERDIGLVLQLGAPAAYGQLPYLKERLPGLQIVDTLYNKVGHGLNHFLYEACIDGVIVESREMHGFIAANTAKPDAAIHVIESGVDLDRFASKAIAAGDPGQRRFVVGYLGRMSPEKNPLGFVDLAEHLHRAMPELAFRIYGEGPMAGEVAARIAAGSASAAIAFGGFADTSASALAGIDVLIVPSKLDGRPNVVMEANACGIPVVGAPVGGIPELIETGVNGVVLAPRQHVEIAAFLAGLVADPERFARLRASSRALAERRFDRRRMMDDYETVYRRYLRAAESHGRA